MLLLNKDSRELQEATKEVLQTYFLGDFEEMYLKLLTLDDVKWAEFKAAQTALRLAQEQALQAAPAESPLEHAIQPSGGDSQGPAPTEEEQFSRRKRGDALQESVPEVQAMSPASPSTRRAHRKRSAHSMSLAEPTGDVEDGGPEKRRKTTEQAAESRSVALQRARAAQEERQRLLAEEVRRVRRHYTWFEHSSWEGFLPDRSSRISPFKTFHEQHWPKRSGRSVRAFDLILVDGPWGVNTGDAQLRDQGFSQTKMDNLCTRFMDILDEQGTLLVFCTQWQCGDWKKALEQCGFKTSTVPITVTFHPSSTHRNRAPTDLTPSAHTVIPAWRIGARQTTKNLVGEGFHRLNSTFPARSSVISNYVPPNPMQRLRDEDGKALRVEEKSVELFEELILRFSNLGDRVLDCFAGTAASAIACARLNRSWVGCEIDEVVYRAAKKRLDKKIQFLLQARILQDPSARLLEGPRVTQDGWANFAKVLEVKKIIPMKPQGVDRSKALDEQLADDIKHNCKNLVYVADTPAKGKGLFAAQDIPRGTIIGYYWGDVMSHEGLKQYAKSQGVLMRNMERRLELEHLAACAGCHHLLPEVNGSKACALTFMNCARGPDNTSVEVPDNAEVVSCLSLPNISDAFLGLVASNAEEAWAYPHLCPVVSRTDIVKDSEILFDYGVHYWESAKVDVIGEECDK